MSAARRALPFGSQLSVDGACRADAERCLGLLEEDLGLGDCFLGMRID